MERMRDLASRQRASLSSLSASRSRRKANDDNANLTTNSENNASESIQPGQAPQGTVQAQPTQLQEESASTTGLSEENKKKGKATIKRQHGQQLIAMAEAVINQSEVISETNRELSIRFDEAARAVLEANEYIERKDQEIAEINKKLKVMENNFDAAMKQLDKAKLLASQAIESGCLEQSRLDTKAQWHKNTDSLINEAKTSDIGTWTKAKTHVYLRNLIGIYIINKDFVQSTDLSESIVSIAKQFTFHGNYEDVDAQLLFHLVNGHDPHDYLRKCQDEDHKAASRYPDDHLYRPKAQTGANDPVTDIEKELADVLKQYVDIEPNDKVTGTVGNPDSFSRKVMDALTVKRLDEVLKNPNLAALTKCAVPGCWCHRLEMGGLRKWAGRLHRALMRKPCWGPEVDRKPLLQAVAEVAHDAQNFGVDVSLSFRDDQRLPGIMFMHKVKDHPTKSSEALLMLQASAEVYFFRFGTCTFNGKEGYIIMPAYTVMDGKVATAMHTQTRMNIYKIIQEQAEYYIDEAWGVPPDELCDGRREIFINGLEFFASEYYFERVEEILKPDGSIVETFKPELAKLIEGRFMKEVYRKHLELTGLRSAKDVDDMMGW